MTHAVHQLIPSFASRDAVGNHTVQVQSVLGQDFEKSGLFKLLDPASFLAPAGEGLTGIDYSKWTAVGV